MPGPETDYLKRSTQATQAIANGLLAPIQKTGRLLVTKLGGAPYAASYVVGNYLLPVFTAGYRAANPRIVAGATAAALMKTAAGDFSMANIPSIIASGEEMTAGKAYKILDQFAMIDKGQGGRHSLRESISQPGNFATNFLPNLAKGVEKVGSVMTPPELTSFANNYQAISTFMSVVKDTSQEGVEAAINKTASLMGDFRALNNSKVGMKMRSVANFYSWNAYIWPQFVKQLVDNPKMLADFAETRDYLNSEWGQKVAMSPDALTPYERDEIVLSPHQYKTQPGEAPRFVTLAFESPQNMMGGFIPTVEALAHGDKKRFWGMFATVPRLILEAAFQQDLSTGNTIPGIGIDFERMASDMGYDQKFKSLFGNAAGGAKAVSFLHSLTSKLAQPITGFDSVQRALLNDSRTQYGMYNLNIAMRAAQFSYLAGQLYNHVANREVFPVDGAFVGLADPSVVEEKGSILRNRKVGLAELPEITKALAPTNE
jgi:hypothetical protein